ncbi:E-selectin-like isoform X4 [Myxocyprinus asiaticus]|uniref:E-selectin-like isoform X4 n=1 Tax=Myxocyprinus asiaticus TaxID=70543 RepID=UPI00222323BB|nr:E-selectin-like isoform X4 [Myxocyprinus asiaticus]
MGFCNNIPLHGAKFLRFFASLVLISSVLNMWRSTEGWSYHHSEKIMNWERARNWCRQHYTDMVAIQNKEESSHLNNFLPVAKTGYYWIGIRKINGNWTWVGTNKQLSQKAENWATNEPNNGGNNEDCVEIYIKRKVDAGKWNDMSCAKENTALCYTVSCKDDSCISGHGECVETINNHTCSCFEGFYGERCEHVVKCKPEDITTPDHASIQCSHPYGNFSYDSKCEYSCEEGYKVKGYGMTRCTSTKEWSSKPPTCELVQCPELKDPQEGSMQCHHPMGNFSYQSTCEFVCEEGYKLGDSSSSTLFCGASGHWNDSQPYCEIVKCKPEDITTPHHGSVQCSHSNGNFSYDSHCEYSCEEGYNVKGSGTTSCTSTKEWSSKPPTCELVQCPELTEPQEGTMQCHHPMGNFSYQSTCDFVCDEGYTLGESSTSTLFCGASGHWNDSQSNCEIVQCPELTKPQEGTMQCHHPMGNFSYQSTCEFVCEKGYTLGDSSSSTLFCGASGHWNDSQPYCEIVKCKPEDITTPHHGSVQCSHPNGNFSYDSQCEYSCEEGYNVKGSGTTSCTSTKEWSSKPPTCELVQCPELTEPQEGTIQCHHPMGNFSYQSTCDFVCDEGYTLGESSTSTLFCGANGHWNDSQSNCEIVQCPELTKPQEGTMQCHHPMGNFSYQSTCEFVCEEGYTLGDSSSYTLFCGANGHWNDSQPYCEFVKCKPEDITTPHHGSVQCSHPSGQFSYDSQCEYSCEEGYNVKGSTMTRCTSTKEWSSKPPTCELVQCPELTEPLGGTMQCHDPKGNFNFQSTCEFVCKEGYTLRNPGSSTLFCGITGRWNDSQPNCEFVKCKPEDITTPDHGSVQCSHPKGNFSYDSQCEYTCEEGYNVKGSSMTTCTSTTEWSSRPPTCELIQCPVLENLADGEMRCTSNFSYGSKCIFSCAEGYRLQGGSEISCMKTSEWSQETPRCEAVVCPQIQEPVNGHMNCSSAEPTFGTVCTFSCLDNHQLQNNETVLCNHTGNWSGEVAVCQAHSEALVTEVTLGVAAAVGSSSLLLVLWMLKKLRRNANKFDLNSNSETEDHPQVYKNSIDSLI